MKRGLSIYNIYINIKEGCYTGTVQHRSTSLWSRYLFVIFSLSQDFLLNLESEDEIEISNVEQISRASLNFSYQVWRPRQSVSLAASRLPVAEDSGGEAVNPHVD